MYLNLSDFKNQCIACNYCKRFLMYLHIDRRHLILIDSSRYGSTQLSLMKYLPDGHWQLPPASFIASCIESIQIFRAVRVLQKILPAGFLGLMASDRLPGLHQGVRPVEVLSFNIIRKNCILGYFYINIIKSSKTISYI